MRLLGLLLALIGLGFLAVLIARTDLAVLSTQFELAGLETLALILALYVVYFAADASNWYAAYQFLRPHPRWFMRIYLVRMIGDAYNNITPTATVGGDAIKAWLMKHRYHIGLTASTASLVIARTTSMLGLLAFAAIGSILLLFVPPEVALPRAATYAGLGVLITGTVLLFGLQYWRISTRIVQIAGDSSWGRKLSRTMARIEAVDADITNFYHAHPRRVLSGMFAALLTWTLGAVELWVVLRALTVDIGFERVWVIEVVTQLVRAGSFFIPAGVGTQDAVIVYAIGAATGNQAAGIATALIRRAREIIWIALSLLIGAIFTSREGRSPDIGHG